MGIKECTTSNEEESGFLSTVTIVFRTLITKVFDQFEVIRNLRKSISEKFRLMFEPLNRAYQKIMDAVAKLQGLPKANFRAISVQLRSFFNTILIGYLASTQQKFNDVVKAITSKSFDGFMQGLGLLFPFNLLTNTLSIGKIISSNVFDLAESFNTFLTHLTDSVKKQISKATSKLDAPITQTGGQKETNPNFRPPGCLRNGLLDSKRRRRRRRSRHLHVTFKIPKGQRFG